MSWDLSLPMNPTMSEYLEISKKVYEATGLRDTLRNGQLRCNFPSASA